MSLAETIVQQPQTSQTVTETTDKEQTPATPELGEAPKDDNISSKLSLIARKERSLVQKQQEFQRHQQEVNAKLKAMEDKLKSYEENEKLWQQDPFKAIESKGWDYQKLTERQLSDGELTPKDLEKRMEEKLKTYEQKLEEEKKSREKEKEDFKTAQEKEIIQNFKLDLKKHLSAKADAYKLTNLFDAEAELTYDVIDAYYKQHGEVLEHDKAAEMSEKYFMGEFEKAAKALGWTKIAEEEKAVIEEKKSLGVAPIKKPTQTTLTNSMNATTAPNGLPAKNEEDRIKRALMALDKNK